MNVARFLLTLSVLSHALCGREITNQVWQQQAGDNLAEIENFRTESMRQFGERGEKSFQALVVKGMPATDLQSLRADHLLTNLDYALRARKEFPWSAGVSDELFFNHVLPYAILDESRDDWRPKFYQLCRELVKDCNTASEAAQVLNRDLFNELNVHYHTGRKKPNQSPFESMASGKATCTGLSIILAYGCRAVGIPARLVGTPLWSDKSGNHTWVEIWDGAWHFLGADEYDAKGLNRAWFVGRAAQAKANQWQHAIWATSWNAEEAYFPLVWNLANQSVGAVNVTDRYVREAPAETVPRLGIRVFAKQGGPRVEAELVLLDDEGEVLATVQSKAGQADLNDVATLPMAGEGPWKVRVTFEQEERVVTVKQLPEQALDIFLEGKESLDIDKLVRAWKEEGRAQREEELKGGVIRAAGKEMKFLEKKFGEAPPEGHALWISLHGGGGAPPQVNDQQWRNQIRLYQPAEGYYVAPRAPTDTWNLWHQEHIDALFDRLIANYVICRGVDPNRIYLLGYSAGGDGVYQLAPRMADRFAAAAMMAGHPNETQPEGLRNLPFEIFMGENDSAYDRNKIAAKWKEWLAEKKEGDPEGYPHRVTIYPGLGHWMDGKDAAALPRMIKHTRREWPRKVVWLQDDVTHERFYWLGIEKNRARQGLRLVGQVQGQVIALKGEVEKGIQLWLSDELINLDQEVTVFLNDKEVFRGGIPRDSEVVMKSLRSRCGMIATALLEL